MKKYVHLKVPIEADHPGLPRLGPDAREQLQHLLDAVAGAALGTAPEALPVVVELARVQVAKAEQRLHDSRRELDELKGPELAAADALHSSRRASLVARCAFVERLREMLPPEDPRAVAIAGPVGDVVPAEPHPERYRPAPPGVKTWADHRETPEPADG